MATFLDGSGQILPEFRRFVVTARRKPGLAANALSATSSTPSVIIPSSGYPDESQRIPGADADDGCTWNLRTPAVTRRRKILDPHATWLVPCKKPLAFFTLVGRFHRDWKRPNYHCPHCHREKRRSSPPDGAYGPGGCFAPLAMTPKAAQHRPSSQPRRVPEQIPVACSDTNGICPRPLQSC